MLKLGNPFEYNVRGRVWCETRLPAQNIATEHINGVDGKSYRADIPISDLPCFLCGEYVEVRLQRFTGKGKLIYPASE